MLISTNFSFFIGVSFLCFSRPRFGPSLFSFSSSMAQHYCHQPRILVQKHVFSHFQSDVFSWIKDISSGAFWLCFRELDSLCAFPPKICRSGGALHTTRRQNGEKTRRGVAESYKTLTRKTIFVQMLFKCCSFNFICFSTVFQLFS